MRDTLLSVNLIGISVVFIPGAGDLHELVSFGRLVSVIQVIAGALEVEASRSVVMLVQHRSEHFGVEVVRRLPHVLALHWPPIYDMGIVSHKRVEGRHLSGGAKRVDLPRDLRFRAFSERVVQKLVTLINIIMVN